MNITFTIHNNHEIEWTSNNIIKSNMFIKQINMLIPKSNNSDPKQVCLVMTNVNNMNERKQSPLFIINTDQQYTQDIINLNVPPSRKWIFYITDLNGNKINLKNPITVSLILYELNHLEINK